MALNLSPVYSTRPEIVEIYGRISGAGAVIAPVAAPGFNVTHTANSGIFTIGVVQPFAEYLGVTVQVVQAVARSAAVNLTSDAVWNATTRALTVTVWNGGTGLALATDAQILELDLNLAFADSRVA